jgi:tRNA wybutosine-synthesizing protein 3
MTTLFDRQKAEKLSKVDLSRKGSVDAPIFDFLKNLNSHPDYVSLSSCSGRIIIFISGENIKKGCQWILVKHDKVTAEDEPWKKVIDRKIRDGILTLKFEPFILHVQCRGIDAAKKLLQLANESGFRNSGFTFGKAGKVVLAIRSTHGLQVPLSDESGILLVDEKYVQFVVGLANSKLELNGEKIKKLEKCCETAKLWPSSSSISDDVVKDSSDEKEVTKVVSKLENTKEDEHRDEIVEN